ncbi:thiol:disulfide interchange protein [Sphingomonas paeninsulae]|uniref:Thiol:disulfide interchange protein n=1 Tax=Sphingomonas paeninsulae TaxID=2319844 RepID=A0A494TIU5_SPHPE|nr:thioredoxin family protein [Sphingomonas paeninsulae]AYJ87414.1 thiol:disulfide interchange protein [Sphingomonas paeninsulae]
MKAIYFWLVTLVAIALVPQAVAQPTHIQPRLVSEVMEPVAGSTITIAVEMRTDKGWHGYWKNPGEAGLAPRFAWDLPKGASVGAPAFPVPHALTIAGLTNYVFEADHALLFPLKIPAGIAAGTILPIRVKADWLACTDQVCVPERGEFSLDLQVGAGAVTNGPQFDGWRAKLPTPLGSVVTFARRGDRVRLAIPYPATADVADAHFFPNDNGVIVDAAPQLFSRSGEVLIASLSATKGGMGIPAGVLSIGGRGFEIVPQAGAVPADGTPLNEQGGNGSLTTILLSIGGALLGGLILNIMPCVFPILSLKALSLAKAGGDANPEQERAARRDALSYTASAVAVCVALGGAILVLRAGGSAVGWAFQLQDPRVIIVLLLLVVAIALNLAGLFELPAIGGGIAAQGNGFVTGALAAFIATPCTGPFMGAALGAALVLPPAAAMAVFAGLGLGLALPFLALGFFPVLRRMLPKPGAWMATLRRILSVPMFLTALGLAWLLGRQAGVDALVRGLGLALFAALGFWWTGLRQARGKGGLAIGAVMAVVAGAIGVAVVPQSAPASAATVDALKSEPFSEARLAALQAEGRPVFVYFTADWCLTCKVNERIAIDRPEVAAAFGKAKVATLVGDWTRSDPTIGRFLNAQGRSGVPLYLYYLPGNAKPEVLPQVLTPGTLIALTS